MDPLIVFLLVLVIGIVVGLLFQRVPPRLADPADGRRQAAPT